MQKDPMDLGLSRIHGVSRLIDISLSNSLPLIQPHLVGDHRNKLRVGGLAAQVVDGIPEIAVQGIHISPVPRHLDGMADGALHPAGSSAVALRDLRVEPFRHRIDVLRLVHGQKDGVPQELVALNVGNKLK